MPIIPDAPKRPWRGNTEHKPFQKNNDNKFYHTTEWRKFRKEHLIIEPLCRECKKQGIIQDAHMVDHIKPINPVDAYDTKGGFYGEPLDHDNSQSLCDHRGNNCHNKKRGKERHNK